MQSLRIKPQSPVPGEGFTPSLPLPVDPGRHTLESARGPLAPQSPSRSDPKINHFLHQIFKPFWSDINPIWGVWHEPLSRYDHVRKCYQTIYTANSHGMRDRERTIKSNKKRIVVLGDSFTEGFGLKRHERWTDQLEEKTQIPHLNFGNAGIFGPTQYSLLYENLVKKFEKRF